ncbi:hypothetical protein, partial [Segatella hominis]|uniref:hypothetical protein n=1 Tax=Segatella hominis TaxID=2518605 RepID=UPI003AB93DD7
LNFLLCPGIFFSLPTQEFFRGQGKIKVGTGELLSHRRVYHGIMTHPLLCFNQILDDEASHLVS